MLTTTSITAVSVSILSAQSTLNEPESIQRITGNAQHLAIADGDREERHPGQQRRDDQEQRGHIFRRLGADRAAAEAGDQRADERKKDDSVVHGCLSPSSC